MGIIRKLTTNKLREEIIAKSSRLKTLREGRTSKNYRFEKINALIEYNAQKLGLNVEEFKRSYNLNQNIYNQYNLSRLTKLAIEDVEQIRNKKIASIKRSIGKSKFDEIKNKFNNDISKISNKQLFNILSRTEFYYDNRDEIMRYNEEMDENLKEIYGEEISKKYWETQPEEKKTFWQNAKNKKAMEDLQKRVAEYLKSGKI